MRSLPSNVVEHVLQWLDLASHLRLRETSTFDRDETPRRTTTLVARGCEQARRCQEKIFTPDKYTRLQSITLDIVAPNSSRSSSSSSSHSGSSGGSPTPPPPPTPTHHVHLWSHNSSLSSFLDDASCAARRTALPLLVREHRPAELWFKNMIRGAEFSDALLSLEENLDQVRRHTRVLHFGLATGGPRPYQDPRSHHWCLLRLRRLLGSAAPSNGDGGGGGGGGAEGAGEAGEERGGESAARAELADLTRDVLGAAAAAATMPHLVGRGGAEEDGVSPVGERAARRAVPEVVGQACWPRLSELRLSCGIMAGDLEGLAECLGSLPQLQVLDLRGHSFRPPATDFTALARALRASASTASPTAPASKPGRRLRTLTLKYFKVQGAAGVAALGEALSAERFPRLAALSIDGCRLTNPQLCALAATLPGMSRALASLSLRNNYALSDEGIKALVEALRTGSASASASASASDDGVPRSGCCSCSGTAVRCSRDDDAVRRFASEEAKKGPISAATTRSAAECSGGDGRHAGAPASRSGADATKPPPPQRAPAWSTPFPSPPQPPPLPPPPPPTTTTTGPSSSAFPPCTCGRRSTTACVAAAATTTVAVAAAAAAAPGDVDSSVARNAAPLRLESLDMSYSCWWSGPSGRPRTGRDGGKDGGPFASLLEALRGGHPCPPLRSLRLEGCYLGDTAMGQLVAALESETGSCRALRALNVNGNLFSEVGVRLFGHAFLAGKMPPLLRMAVGVVRDGKSCHRSLHADMPLEAKSETIAAWVEHQNGLHRCG